jgi:N-acetyl-gamma-glutamylphosphate reductase
MKTYSIIGERSKIAKYLIKYMPKGFKQVPESQVTKSKLDVLFLSTDSKKALIFIKKYQNTKTQIIDLSGSQKLKSYTGAKDQQKSFFNFFYGLNQINPIGTRKHIANPGCSSLGVLTALFPIKHLLTESVFVDVKFSKSAMRYSSDNQKHISNNIKLLHPLSHFQQDEINYVLKGDLEVSLSASVVGIDRGISLNIFAKTKKNVDIEKKLIQYYKNNSNIIVSTAPKDLSAVIDTTKIYIYVKQNKDVVLINAVFDNLIFGGAYNAVQYIKT